MTSLLVHDDRYGPFVVATPEAEASSGTLVLSMDYLSGKQDVLVKQLIVPLPPKTFTISTDAHIAGRSGLEKLYERENRAVENTALRTVLMKSGELKRAPRTGDFQDVAASLAWTPLPARVWVSEFWTRPLDGPDSSVAARVVMDATVLRDASLSRYLWGHLGDKPFDLNAWEHREEAPGTLTAGPEGSSEAVPPATADD
ncbi:MAG: hypothetical protein IPH65_02290 [Dehalococcoidia bacterium]|uniref:hypothetical protein n=1 Tax=Candidatus Amarobacter glycogenicus TaxID=3140699 RepID=UPI003135A815|nr:hypothetical protein [Dehalococcoidia bacterium]